MEAVRITQIKNLTNHAIHLYENRFNIDPAIDDPILVLPPEGALSRVRAKTINTGSFKLGGLIIPQTLTYHTDVSNIPMAEPGVLFIVSYHPLYNIL